MRRTTTLTINTVRLITMALIVAIMLTGLPSVEAEAQVLTIGGGEAAETAELTAYCYSPYEQLMAKIGITGPEGQWVATRMWVFDTTTGGWTYTAWEITQMKMYGSPTDVAYLPGAGGTTHTLVTGTLATSSLQYYVMAELWRWNGQQWVSGQYVYPRTHIQYSSGVQLGSSAAGCAA
jgi:hypothetical protein